MTVSLVSGSHIPFLPFRMQYPKAPLPRWVLKAEHPELTGTQPGLLREVFLLDVTYS